MKRLWNETWWGKIAVSGLSWLLIVIVGGLIYVSFISYSQPEKNQKTAAAIATLYRIKANKEAVKESKENIMTAIKSLNETIKTFIGDQQATNQRYDEKIDKIIWKLNN